MADGRSGRRKRGNDETVSGTRQPSPEGEARAYDKKTIALVYDFDGTLSPKPMQEYAFLPKIDADPEAFWAESNRLAAEQGADPLITYMHLLYRKAKEKGVRIDRDDLVAVRHQFQQRRDAGICNGRAGAGPYRASYRCRSGSAPGHCA